MTHADSKIGKDAVDKYIDDMDPKLRVFAKKIRSIIRKAIPQAVERIWMGIPNYAINGSGISSIADYSNHINLYFLFGAKLKSKLLQGTGKGMRHIKIAKRGDIEEKEITRLLKQAASLVAEKGR